MAHVFLCTSHPLTFCTIADPAGAGSKNAAHSVAAYSGGKTKPPSILGGTFTSTSPPHPIRISVVDTLAKKQETTEYSDGQSRLHLPGDAAKGPPTGNFHYSNSPRVLSPHDGRAASFDSLRENRAAGSGLGDRSGTGPSKENRRLRNALLSRTFDSQIAFGREEETLRDFPSSTVAESDHGSLQPAGSARVGRVAEGAAWTSGGRRLILGASAFTSHLGNGLRVTRDEAGRIIERPSPPCGNGTADDDLVRLLPEGDNRRSAALARKSKAAAAAREPPVWIPPQGLRGKRMGGGGRIYTSTDRGTGPTIGPDKSPSHPVSLAQVAGGDTVDVKHGGEQRKEDRVPHDDGMSTPSICAAPPTTSTTAACNRNEFSGEEFQEERSAERSSVCSSHGRVHAAEFDWWGGGTMESRVTPGREGMGRIDGGRGVTARANTVSDTYKSSLVFG